MRYSTCKPIDDVWSGVGFGAYGLGIIALILLITSGISTSLAVLMASFAKPTTIYVAAGALIAACLAGIVSLNRIRDYFYDYKLACIEHNTCVVAKAILMEHNADGDKSIDLLLAPANEKTTLADYQTKYWQSQKFIYKNIGLHRRGWKLVPNGNRGAAPLEYGDKLLPFFHCELQGTKIDDWISGLIGYLIVLIIMAIGAIAAVSLAVAVGPIGWVLLGLILLFLILASIFGFSAFGGDDDEASIGVDKLKDATPNADGFIITDSNFNRISNGDHLLIHGPHITDTGHNPNCWNEIHPIVAIAKVRLEDYEKVNEDVKDSIMTQPSQTFNKLCAAITDWVNNHPNEPIRPTSHSLVVEHKTIG